MLNSLTKRRILGSIKHLKQTRAAAILLIFILLPVILSVCFFLRADDSMKDSNGSLFDTMYFSIGKEANVQKIHCWVDKTSNINYVFLPAYEGKDIRIYFNNGGFINIGGTDINSGDTLDIQFDEPYKVGFLSHNKKILETGTLIFMRSDNIPAMFISTKSGSMKAADNDRSVKEEGAMSLVSSDGKVEYAGDLNFIKGRGNVTWDYAKKPYNIELESPCDLLGMGESQNWVLLANFSDGSYIRNKIAYDLASEAGLTYSPKSEFVDLYLNGEYAGLYQLCEKVEIGKNSIDIADLEKATEKVNTNRLNNFKLFNSGNEAGSSKGFFIEHNPSDITGGYLMELDISSRLWSESSGFVTNNGQVIAIDSPKYASKEQVEYISTFMQEFEDAVYSADGVNHVTGKRYTDYLDLDSWVKKYIVEEIIKNQDAGSLSEFIYKPADSQSNMLYPGPIWDCDLSIGNGESSIRSPDGFYANQEKKTSEYDSPWYAKLYSQKDFYSAVVAEYKKTFLPLLTSLLDNKVDDYSNRIRASASMDKIRWINEPKDDLIVMFDTLDENTAYIKDFLRERIKFLSSAWTEQTDYHTVSFLTDYGPRNYFYSIEDGKTMSDLPVPQADKRYVFEGWYYKDTDAKFDISTPITKDITLYAKCTYDNRWLLMHRIIMSAPIDIVLILLIIMFIFDIRINRASYKKKGRR